MSKTLSTLLDREIRLLAKQTGYPAAYLMELWIEECTEGEGDWGLFKGITLERDW